MGYGCQFAFASKWPKCLAARGTLPKDVMVFAKPVSFATLQGYVTAKEAAKARAQ